MLRPVLLLTLALGCVSLTLVRAAEPGSAQPESFNRGLATVTDHAPENRKPTRRTAPRRAPEAGPADEARPMVDRPLIGAKFHGVPELLLLHLPQVFGENGGALVGQVDPHSAAARAGLEPGDIVLAVNRRRVDTPRQLEEALQRHGRRPAELTLLHAGVVHRVVMHPAYAAPAEIAPPVAAGAGAVAINLSTPAGTVAISGTGGRYRLQAGYRGPNGRPVRIDREGTLRDIREVVEQLPPALRTAVSRQLDRSN